jgi:hypothetical protein
MRFVLGLLLAFAVVATTGQFASAVASGDRFALVIGNAKYPDSEAPLKDAINDAREMAKELRRDGFDVETGENLTKNAMRKALDVLYGKIKSGSVALIFFSGFGLQSDRQSYLIPVNAQVWSEADVRRDGFSIDTVLKEMSQRGAKIKIAILNASRRNPYERRFRSVSQGLAPVIAPSNSIVMYSTALGTVDSEPASSNQSMFMTELIKQMRTPGLSGEEVFIRTRFSLTRASGGKQTPWLSSSLAEKFYFDPNAASDSSSAVATTTNLPESESGFPPSATSPQSKSTFPPSSQFPGTKPAPAEPVPNNVPTLASDPNEKARRDYQHAEQIGTRRSWNDFLDMHPSGQYATLARDKLAKLESPPVVGKPPEPGKSIPIGKSPEIPVKNSAKDDEAILALSRQIDKNPSDTDAHYKRGILYAKNNDYALATKDFDAVIRARPENPDALNNRCWARAMLDEIQAALRDCDAALRLRPRFANAFDSRGLLKLKSGQPTDALHDYNASLQINGRQASSLYGRGIAKIRSGNAAGGRKDIAAAKAIDPKIAEEFAKYGIR